MLCGNKQGTYTWQHNSISDVMPHCQEFRLVTRADVAQMFGVCVKTVDNYIKEGLLPHPVQFASREYWHPDDMQSFMDATFKRTLSGMRAYRYLVYLGASQMVEANFPMLRTQLGEQEWRLLIEGFVRQSVWTSPYYGDLHHDFMAYLLRESAEIHA